MIYVILMMCTMFVLSEAFSCRMYLLSCNIQLLLESLKKKQNDYPITSYAFIALVINLQV